MAETRDEGQPNAYRLHKLWTQLHGRVVHAVVQAIDVLRERIDERDCEHCKRAWSSLQSCLDGIAHDEAERARAERENFLSTPYRSSASPVEEDVDEHEPVFRVGDVVRWRTPEVATDGPTGIVDAVCRHPDGLLCVVVVWDDVLTTTVAPSRLVHARAERPSDPSTVHRTRIPGRKHGYGLARLDPHESLASRAEVEDASEVRDPERARAAAWLLEHVRSSVTHAEIDALVQLLARERGEPRVSARDVEAWIAVLLERLGTQTVDVSSTMLARAMRRRVELVRDLGRDSWTIRMQKGPTDG